MDVLTLIGQARQSGLTLGVDDGRLTIRGPRTAAALAQALGARRDDVIAALSSDLTPTWGERQSPPGGSEAAPPRPRWAILPGCKIVSVPLWEDIPPEATAWCHEGDTGWTRTGYSIDNH